MRKIIENMEKINGVFSGQDLEAIENMPIDEGFAFTQKKLDLFFGSGWKGSKGEEVSQTIMSYSDLLEKMNTPLSRWLCDFAQLAHNLYMGEVFNLDLIQYGLKLDTKHVADSYALENAPLLEFIRDTPYKTLASFITRILFLECRKRYIVGNLPIQDKLSTNNYWEDYCKKRITPEKYVEDTIAYLFKIKKHFQEGKEYRLTKREIILHDIISWPSIFKYTEDNIRASKQIQKELRGLESLIKSTQVFYGHQTTREFLQRTKVILEKNNLQFSQESSDYMELYLDTLFE